MCLAASAIAYASPINCPGTATCVVLNATGGASAHADGVDGPDDDVSGLLGVAHAMVSPDFGKVPYPIAASVSGSVSLGGGLRGLSVAVFGSGTDFYNANSRAQVTFDWAVVQKRQTPVTVQMVPVDIVAKLSVSGSATANFPEGAGSTTASAGVTIFADNGEKLNALTTTCGPTGCNTLACTPVPGAPGQANCNNPSPGSVTLFLGAPAVPGFEYSGKLQAAGGLNVGNNITIPGGYTGIYSATADPDFFIDPSFPYADDFEIIFSPNLGASAEAPEPATWGMLGAGIAALAFLALKRKRMITDFDKPRSIQCLCWFFAAVFAALMSSASAAPLPAVFTETVIGNTLPAGASGSCPTTVPGTITLGFGFSSSFDCHGSFRDLTFQSVAMALTTGGRMPAADVQIHASNMSASASAEVEYSFMIQRANPMAPLTPIPIDFVADLQANVSASNPREDVLARAVIEGDVFGGQVDACLGGVPCQSGQTLQTLSINTQQLLPPDGFVYGIQLRVISYGNSGRDETIEGQAIIDPTIMIDPAFPLRDSYEIIFSPNLTDVPESGTSTLLGCGLLMLGAGIRWSSARRADRRK